MINFFSVKPTLKKVSKYENKFAKLQKKAAEFNFRNQLKVVKKKEFTMEEEDKEVKFYYYSVDLKETPIFSLKHIPIPLGLERQGGREESYTYTRNGITVYLYIYEWSSSKSFSRIIALMFGNRLRTV